MSGLVGFLLEMEGWLLLAVGVLIAHRIWKIRRAWRSGKESH